MIKHIIDNKRKEKLFKKKVVSWSSPKALHKKIYDVPFKI